MTLCLTELIAHHRAEHILLKSDIPDINYGNRHELFLLADGEQKVEYEDDARIKNTAIFTFNKEDHTLGNLLTAHLHKYDFITFAAYKVEHPLKPKFILRVGTDGTVTPKDAVIRCCHDIVATLDKVSREFTKEMELYKIARGGDDAHGPNR